MNGLLADRSSSMNRNGNNACHIIKHFNCFSFNVDLIPVIDGAVHFFIITWTNVGGVFQLIIDGVLQSTLSGIETNGKITGQGRFTVGSIFGDNFHNLNVWDKVCMSLFGVIHRCCTFHKAKNRHLIHSFFHSCMPSISLRHRVSVSLHV